MSKEDAHCGESRELTIDRCNSEPCSNGNDIQSRRAWLQDVSKLTIASASFRVTPLFVALAVCGKTSHWPVGMPEIKWDRDIFAHCKMVISDRRFAAQIRGGHHTPHTFVHSSGG